MYESMRTIIIPKDHAHTYITVHIHTYIHTYILYTYTYIHTSYILYTYIHTYICTYIHTHTHTHTYCLEKTVNIDVFLCAGFHKYGVSILSKVLAC